MTRDEILNMPAGQEIDALIAEKVMGKRVQRATRYIQNEIKPRHARSYGKRMIYEYLEDGFLLKNYSTDIAAAWQVLEKVYEKTGHYEIQAWVRPYHRANLTGSECDTYIAETAPLAICCAALLAMMDGEK